MMLSAWPYREKIRYHLPFLSNVYSSDESWRDVGKGFYSLENTPEHFARPVSLYKNCNYIIMLWEFTSTRSWMQTSRDTVGERKEILTTCNSFSFHLFSVPVSIYHLGHSTIG